MKTAGKDSLLIFLGGISLPFLLLWGMESNPDAPASVVGNTAVTATLAITLIYRAVKNRSLLTALGGAVLSIPGIFVGIALFQELTGGNPSWLWRGGG